MKVKTAFILPAILMLLSVTGCIQKKESPLEGENPVQTEDSFPLEGQIIFQSNIDGDNEIYMLGPGGVEKLTDNDWEDRFPTWAPGGGRIAYYANPDGNDDIFILDTTTLVITPVTRSKDNESDPAWYPDGQSLAFVKESQKFLRSTGALYRIELDSGKTQRIIPRFNQTHGIPDVSPTSPQIVFTGKRMMGWDVAIFDWETHDVSFLEDKGKSCRARFSPDGQRLAYVSSTADGKGDIWTMNPDGSGKKRITFRDSTYDYFPSWSPDGRFIVFNSSTEHNHEADWRLMVIEVGTGTLYHLYDSPGNDTFPDWN
ncbi:hypothetical protein ACFLT9_03995 [Acidobacteriota bacterium]